MTKRQAERLNMIQVVIQYCELNVAATAAIIAFALTLAAIKAKQLLINQLNQLTLPGTTGVTADTKLVRQALIDIALQLSAAVSAYANSVSNNTLLQEVNYTESELKRLKKDDLDDACQSIHDGALSNILVAADFGYDAADVTALATALLVYRNAQQNPRQTEIAIKSANSQIKTAITFTVNSLLKGQLDKMAKTLKKTNPNFLEGYTNARQIVNLPSDTTGVTGQVIESSISEPVPSASVKLFDRYGTTPLYQTTTDTSGNFSIIPVSPGDYRTEVTATGLQPYVDYTLHLSPGQQVSLVISLNPL